MDLSERGESETRHPWESARASFFVDVLADHHVLRDLQHAGPDGAPRRILDVGAGDGYLAGEVRRRTHGVEMSLWDLNYTDVDLASLSADGFVPSTSRPAGPFDLIMLLDVLEHVEDDRRFLDDVLKAAAPNAWVLVSVPAWPLLWSSHDVALAHQRRYRPAEVRALLEGAQVRVLESGGFFHSLVAPRAFSVAKQKALGPDAQAHGVGAWKGGALLANAISTALRAEHRVSRLLSRAGIDAPGLSYWALARR